MVAPLALTSAQPEVVPIRWGLVRSRVWPSPTWPYVALPQHHSVVSSRISHVDWPPALTIGLSSAAVRTKEPSETGEAGLVFCTE